MSLRLSVYKKALVPTLLVFWAETTIAQQTVNGNCNVQLGAQSHGNTVTIICPSGGGGESVGSSVFDRVFGETGLLTDVVLEMNAPDLARGRDIFDLVIINSSDDAIVELNVAWLSVADDLGGLYEVDLLRMLGSSMSDNAQIPPGKRARFTIPLTRAISPAAREIDLTLDNATYVRRGSSVPFSMPLPPLEWPVLLSGSTADDASPSLHSNATARDIRALQAELGRLGYYSSIIDGVWGPASRAALRRAQRALGVPETGRLADGISLLGRIEEL